MANILVVEDEKNMQEIIAEYMHRSSHVCYTSDDGVDALMVLKSHPMDLMIWLRRVLTYLIRYEQIQFEIGQKW